MAAPKQGLREKKTGGIPKEQWQALALVFAGLVVLFCGVWLVLWDVVSSIGMTGVMSAVGVVLAGLLGWRWKTQAPARAEKRQVEQARTLRAAGDAAGAEKVLVQLLKEKAESGRTEGRAAIHWELLSLYRQMQKWDEALGQASAAMAASEGSTGWEELEIAGEAPIVLTELYTRLERWKELEEFTKERLATARGKLGVELCLEAAAALQRQDKAEQSIERLREAARRAQVLEEGRELLYSRSLHALGSATLDAGNWKEACEAFGALRDFARELPPTEPDRAKWDVLGAVGLAQAWVQEGNPAPAAALLNDVIETSGRCVGEEVQAKTLYLLAGALLTAGHFQPARRRAREALALWEKMRDSQAQLAKELLDSVALQEALSGASEVTDSSTEG